jgi:hypothetical protein
MPEPIKEIACTSPEEFLSTFDGKNPIWAGNEKFWVFRGHSNDKDYKLIPTALRPAPCEAELGYCHTPLKGIQPTNEQQIEAELQRLQEFFWAVDSQGLNIPGDSSFLRTPAGWRDLRESMKQSGWPPDGLLPLLALAQHYGVPTRLLDWSDRPLAASFFAVKKAAEKPTGNFLSVWALNLDWIINEAFPDSRPGRIDKMPVYVVTAPRATNPNLHAQGGVFTTENLVEREFPNKVIVSSVDTIVKNEWAKKKNVDPVMAHVTLPDKEAKKLLRLLNQVQINSATIFPGYQGVADALKEREDWDKRERTLYWFKP